MIDYRIPFIGGAVFSCISLMAVQKIRTHREETYRGQTENKKD
jgi:hypothetical protein